MKRIINKIIIVLIMFTLIYHGKIVYGRDETMVEVPEWLKEDILTGILMPENNFTTYYKNNTNILTRCNEIDKKIRDNFGGENPYSEAEQMKPVSKLMEDIAFSADGSENVEIPTWLLECFEDNDDAIYWAARSQSYTPGEGYYKELQDTIIEDTIKYIEDGTNTNPTIKNKLLYLSGDYANGLASRIVSEVFTDTEKRREWYQNEEQWGRLKELLEFYSDENIGPAFTQSAAVAAEDPSDVER